jgi:hypothetical protein
MNTNWVIPTLLSSHYPRLCRLISPYLTKYPSRHLIQAVGDRPDFTTTTWTPRSPLRRFYYDCVVYTGSALGDLIGTVAADPAVFGTD